MPNEIKAETLYNAITKTLADAGTFGLLAAAGDAKAKVPWAQVALKTRDLFLKLAANLTVEGPTA